MHSMDSREESARLAAESLLSGSSSQSEHHYPPPHPQQVRPDNNYGAAGQNYARYANPRGNIQSSTSPSVEYLNEELLAGLRLGGQMSGVRRFFCLFLTFDLLFTFLMWFTCIMLIGNRDVVQALIDEVRYYNVHTSMFDIVMAAACRFTVLLLFYALLYINHWIIIALSTSGTCAFLIFKVFVFNWASAGQPVFQVLIILTSFVLAWGETWFLDFRVIPQETLARAIIIDQNTSNFLRSVYDERTPLMRNFLTSTICPDNYTESIGNFYSPLDSPRGSDDEEEGGSRFRSNQRTRSKEAQLEAEARENFSAAWSVLNSTSGWKREKHSSEGDLVESKGVAKQRKIFRLKGQIEIPPKLLLEELYYKVEDMPAWNPTVIQSRRLQVLDEHTDIVYQVSAEGGGGVVVSREFVILRHWGVKDGTYISSGCSCSHPDAPESKKLIRAHNGPNCWAMQPVPGEPSQCNFLWLLDTDLKGWVPQYMVEAALSTAMLEFLSSLRSYAAKLKEEGKFSSYV